MVWGFGFCGVVLDPDEGLGFRVWGSRLRVEALGFLKLIRSRASLRLCAQWRRGRQATGLDSAPDSCRQPGALCALAQDVTLPL